MGAPSRNQLNLHRKRCCDECGTVRDSDELSVTIGNLQIDRALRQAWWKGQQVLPLSAQLFKVLEFLVQREGRIIQKWAFFANNIFDDDVEDKILDVRICQLRRAFKKLDSEFDLIVTHWGEGFSWRRQQPEQIAA